MKPLLWRQTGERQAYSAEGRTCLYGVLLEAAAGFWRVLIDGCLLEARYHSFADACRDMQVHAWRSDMPLEEAEERATYPKFRR